MAGGQAVVSSVMQLSALAKIPSIPRDTSYNDFPVTVRVRAQERRPPVDIVALIDVSASVGDDEPRYLRDRNRTKTTRLEYEKKAMEEVVKLVGSDDDGWNRLAVVAFNNRHRTLKELKQRSEKWRAVIDHVKPEGDTSIFPALNEAIKILNERDAEEKSRRPAFIILLSDGIDRYFKTKVKKEIGTITYPIHAFSFWADSTDREPSPLEAIPDLKLGTYTPVDERIEKVTEKLSGELSSMLAAVDTRVSLKTVHPGVTLSRVELPPPAAAAASDIVRISEDNESGEVLLGEVLSWSGDETEFAVYLNVPEGGPGNGASVMELLSVGGSYKQSWDGQQVALGESVVTVARPGGSVPPTTRSCKELVDSIEKRLQYWCKVKQDLCSGFNDEGSRCQCLVSEALREASLETINNAMHEDTYTAVQLALKLRQGGKGGTTMENVPLPTVV